MKQKLIPPHSIDKIRLHIDTDVRVGVYDIKVTKIANRYHARLLHGDKIVNEMACELRIDIGYICRQMMRWEDKGGGDKVTSASRNRLNTKPDNFRGPVGKVWYHLPKLKETL